jgi:regulator of protease activity HflC (stomatin/prohibitin superfamily)
MRRGPEANKAEGPCGGAARCSAAEPEAPAKGADAHSRCYGTLRHWSQFYLHRPPILAEKFSCRCESADHTAVLQTTFHNVSLHDECTCACIERSDILGGLEPGRGKTAATMKVSSRMEGSMTTTVIIILAVAAALLVLSLVGLRQVNQAQVMVIERLGKYRRTLTPGLHIIWPVIDHARTIGWRKMQEYVTADGEKTMQAVDYPMLRIDMREQVYDFPRQNVITKDNVAIQINALLYFHIFDAARAVYQISSLHEAIEKLTQTTLRNLVGEMDLDQTLSSRDNINSRLRDILEEASNKWGVKVNRVELQDISPSKEIRETMEKQMRAERDRRAAILEAEGMKAAAVLKAEGSRDAAIAEAEGAKSAEVLRAEGQAQATLQKAKADASAIELIGTSLGSTGSPAGFQIALRYIDALKEMTAGKAEKIVFMPYEASSVLASLGSIREVLGELKPTP